MSQLFATIFYNPVIGNKKEKRNMKSFIYKDLNRGGNGTQLESASWKITYDEQVYWHLPFNKNTRQKKQVK